MADSFIEASFAFTCTHSEMALLEEAFQASHDLTVDFTPADPSPEFLAVFPPKQDDDPWSGFRDIFDDPDFPGFGADIGGANSIGAPHVCTVQIYGLTDFQPEPIAQLLHHCCQETLKSGPIGFEWAATCSKARIGEFGGGWCAIFADRIEFGSTCRDLSAALAEEKPLTAADSCFDDPWGEHAHHPVEDWKAEVANDDTRLGYWHWVAARSDALTTAGATPARH